MTYRKSLLKYCPASFKHHKHTCLPRPHCEYLWELQAKERQPQLGQLTQPWEWISIKYWAVLCLQHRWPSLEVRAFSERAAGLCFSPKESFSHGQSQTTPLLEQSVTEQKCKATGWSDLFSGLPQARLRADLTLPCNASIASCQTSPQPCLVLPTDRGSLHRQLCSQQRQALPDCTASP